MEKFFSWFLTKNGRQFTYLAAGGATISAFALQFIPHTMLNHRYRSIVQLYKNGIPVPVSDEQNKLFNKALDLCKLSEMQHMLYSPYSAFGFDLYHIGSSFSKFGCYIGLPRNFSFTDVEKIDKSSIKILGESVIWALDEAQDFLESLVLSEKAKLYGIAREIEMTQTPKLLLDSFCGCVSVMATYMVSNKLNTQLNLYVKPLAMRVFMYSLVSLFNYSTYCFFKDFSQNYYEQQVDQTLLKKDPIFLEGAQEFYSKVLRRNIALRKLMGDGGVTVYTPLGNDVYFLRQKHLPLVQRKAFFDEAANKNLSLM